MSDILQLMQRIELLEKRILELRGIDVPGNYTVGAILFGNTNGNATEDATNLVWDDTNNLITQDAWIGSISFSNSWADFGAGDEVGYYKDQFGIVHLRGLMKSGTLSTTAFTLPVGYRPEKRLIQATASNTLYGTVQINTNGTVVPVSGSNVYFSLSGVHFRAL